MMAREPFHCSPRFEAGCRMPSGATIELRDRQREQDAEAGSERLLLALLGYGARYGLPNIPPQWCAARLPPPPAPEKKASRDGWSPAEDATILRLRADGLGYGRIAHRLPGRSASAVASRLRLLRAREAMP